jgi:LacI family fructose operon transcriptional repressor
MKRAIVAFDDTNWTSFVNPPLTVAAQPTYELGRRATELLINRIKDPALSRKRYVISGAVFIQKSCATYHKGGDLT